MEVELLLPVRRVQLPELALLLVPALPLLVLVPPVLALPQLGLQVQGLELPLLLLLGLGLLVLALRSVRVPH